ncbi:hypothetical protein LEN26_010336 [Aphanomyces euteiches]|nr:hypothetical protein LEN26_010336 [Aphanomyces euteiches]
MDDDDCYGFGSYEEIFSRPARTSPNRAASAFLLSPSKADARSASCDVEVGTHLMDNGFFVLETDITFSKNNALFHGRHIGLKIKRSGKLLNFNFPRQSPIKGSSMTAKTMCVDSNSRTHALGDLYMDKKELFWHPMRHSDTSQTSTGQVYGSDRYSLRIDRKAIKDIAPTKVQNVVLALSITLATIDVCFEFSFMPGPYHKSSNRDELLSLLMDTPLTDNAPTPDEIAAVFDGAHPAQRNTDEKKQVVKSPRRTQRHPGWKNERDQAIRSYLSMDPQSLKAMKLAKQIEDEFNYPIGPTSTTKQSFLDDKDYRQEQVSTLSRVMDDMKAAWKRNDEAIDRLLSVSCSKNDEDDLVYHDTTTKREISPKEYELRYTKHIIETPIILIGDHGSASRIEFSRTSAIIDSAFIPVRRFELPSVPLSLSGQAKTEAEHEREMFMEEIHASKQNLWQEFAKLTQMHFEKIQSIRVNYARRMEERVLAAKNDQSAKPSREKTSRRRSMVTVQLDDLKENRGNTDKKRKNGSGDDEKQKRQSRRQSVLLQPLEESKSDDESNLCNLCFVSPLLQPCLHSVCDKCWSKLSQGKTDSAECPWDRQAVVPKRIG